MRKTKYFLLILSCFIFMSSFADDIINYDYGEKTIYNGIKFKRIVEKDVLKEVKNGMNPYYLNDIPNYINIDVGRQLFVDNFLIKETNLKRVYHYPQMYENNPILKPDKSWEMIGNKGSGFAAPFSDGIWYDEKDDKFKMWYMAGGGEYNVDGNFGVTCYAESYDGIHFIKPKLDVIDGTNIVDYGFFRDSNTVWIDKEEKDENKRYKMFLVQKIDKKWYYVYKVSKDGIHWNFVEKSDRISDRSTVFKNPFRDVWAFSIRHNVRNQINRELIRARDYMENSDVLEGVRQAKADLKYFHFGPWNNDIRHNVFSSTNPGIYNFDATPYESIMLGLFTVWQGPENKAADALKMHKINQIMLGYSRDGYEYYREDMNPFISYSSDKGAWNTGNIQSVVGSPIIANDKLYFYFSGRNFDENEQKVTSTGMAVLRRDGFVSMQGSGELVTNKLEFNGKYLFVNADVKKGLKVEILDEYNNVIKGYSKDECILIKENNTKCMVKWNDNNDLDKIKNKKIMIKFYLEDGDLYSFWIAKDKKGGSNGYTAGGGYTLDISGKDIN